MSTIVGIIKGNELVLAADSLTKYGDANEPEHLIKDFSKIVSFSGVSSDETNKEENSLAFVGHASFGLVFQSALSRLEEPLDCRDRQAVFESFRRLIPDLKKNCYLVSNDEDSFEGAEVDCLVANQHGLFGVYSLQNVQEYSKFYAFGSGAAYALGCLQAIYEESDSAKTLAERALSAACSFDDSTAAPFHFRTIDLKR